ncbi:hypothetical protein LXL04_006851 [Taraxacum kok-saghyz]
MAAPSQGVKIDWSKSIPLNVRCFVWRALSRRIPVSSNLAIRGITVETNLCTLCNAEIETEDHLLVKCKIAEEVHEWILGWCGSDGKKFQHIEEFLDYIASWGNCPMKKEIVSLILYCTLWNIWKARNNKIFMKVDTSPAKIANEIISQSYEWYKYRSSKSCNRWID